MSTFDYGNTRLRARFSHLLMKEMLEEMTRADNLDGFLSLLIKSSYKASVEKALTYSSGIQVIHTLLEIESEKLFRDYQNFYTDSAWNQIGLIFSYRDLQNIYTVVRGILGKVPHLEIQDLLTRSGRIPFRILRDLSMSRNFSDLVSKMIAFQIPYTDVLLRNQTILPTLQGAQIELMLEKVFYENILGENKSILNQSKILKEYFDMHADQENIICALRIVRDPEIITRNGINPRECFLNAGTISRSQLLFALNEKEFEKVIMHFNGSVYFSCLQEGLQAFNQTGLLTDFEEKLRKLLLERASRYPFDDPIGIGVPIGYMVRKQNEMQNLWWIAKGIQLGFDSVDIIEHLEILT